MLESLNWKRWIFTQRNKSIYAILQELKHNDEIINAKIETIRKNIDTNFEENIKKIEARYDIKILSSIM